MNENVSAHAIITGRVQGVFFRLETQKAALKRGVTGWVRNLPDGSVEVIAEGEKSAVNSLIKWCWKGSPGSRVDAVNVEWQAFTGKFSTFDVTYG